MLIELNDGASDRPSRTGPKCGMRLSPEGSWRLQGFTSRLRPVAMARASARFTGVHANSSPPHREKDPAVSVPRLSQRVQ